MRALHGGSVLQGRAQRRAQRCAAPGFSHRLTRANGVWSGLSRGEKSAPFKMRHSGSSE